MKHFISSKSAYLLAFSIPLFILFTIYLLNGIYWGSDTSPLLGDGFHQYVIFDTALRNILHGKDSLFYTFTSGLGLNFYALSSYYLGSLLSPLLYFFDVKNMPDAVYLFTMVKFGLMGLSAFFSLKRMYRSINQWLLLSLSTSYALLSFATSQIEIKTWLDAFILFPLIILGLYKLVNQQKIVLYYVSLTLLFVTNYYFGFMMAIFLVPWFCLQVLWKKKAVIKSFLLFTATSILSAMTSAIVLIPTIIDLRSHGESFTSISQIINPDGWYFDFFAKNLVGSFDTTKYGSIPMIYVGLFPLILAILFFFLPRVKFHVKLAYGLLIAFILSSFYLVPLDLFWQGMHAPNMFLHRYSWVLSLVIIYMAAETLSRLQTLRFRDYLLASGFLVLGFSCVFYFKSHYDFLSWTQFLLTAEFLLAYSLLAWAFSKNIIRVKRLSIMTLLFVTAEMGLNTYFQVDGIATEWVFAGRSSYETNLDDITSLVKLADQESRSFYRLEQDKVKTGNDSMKYGYNGISQFSSVRNTDTSSTLDKLGFQSSGTNLNLRYQNNTILMDSLFSVKYNLSDVNPLKYGFNLVGQGKILSLYENDYQVPLAFYTAGTYKDIKLTDLTLDNQRDFVNQLTGKKLDYFYRLEPDYESVVAKDGNVELSSDQQANVKYRFTASESGQFYLTLPDLNLENENRKDIDITVNGLSRHFDVDNKFAFFNLGYYEKGQAIDLEMTFPENKKVSYGKVECYVVAIDEYKDALGFFKNQDIQSTSQKNQVQIDFKNKKDQSIFITLPYDKGWSARLNGEKVPILRAQTGFMKVDVPEESGKLTLTFIPDGFFLGGIVSITGIVLFAILSIVLFVLKKRQSKGDSDI